MARKQLGPGAFPVASGGTGDTTLPANSLLVGNGAGAVAALAPGKVGEVLTSDGTVWSSGAPGLAAVIKRRPNESSELVSAAASISYVAGGFATTIASGAVVIGMPTVAGKAGLVGTASGNLVQIGSTSCYGPAWRTWTDGTVGTIAPSSPWGLDFWIAGSRYVEFMTWGYGLGCVQVFVDDRKLQEVPVMSPPWTSPNSYNTFKIDLGVNNNGAPRRVRVMVHGVGIGSVWAEPTAVVWEPEDHVTRLAVLGDSFTEGTGQASGYSIGTWLQRFSNMVGFRDFWNGAIGGTGLNTVNGSAPNYKSRATSDIAPSGANVVIVGTYYNDKANSRTAAQIAADYTTVFTTLQAMSSKPVIIALGAFDPAGTNGTDYTNIDAQAKAACITAGAAWIAPASGEVVNTKGTTVLNNGAWITTANKSQFIGADTVHPNDAGHKYLAHRMQEAYLAITAEPRITVPDDGQTLTDISGSPNVCSVDLTIPAAYSCIRTDYVEIASAITLEVGAGAYLDIT